MIVEPLEWKIRVCSEQCVMTGVSECDGLLQGAHVISQQKLRRSGLDDHRWDVRNGVAACERHHRRNDRGYERFPLAVLPSRVLEFAREVDLIWWVERRYR